MKRILRVIKERLDGGNAICMATISASSGAVPRGQGARMLVDRDGLLAGTIGGGAVEHLAIGMAREQLQKDENTDYHFRLNRNEVEDIGMICGGDVRVQFQILRPSQPGLKETAAEALRFAEAFEHSWLIQDFSEHAETPLFLYHPEKGLIGKRTDPASEKALRQFFTSEQPTAARLLLGESVYFAEEICAAGRVYVMGGGHVARALVPVLNTVRFPVVVLEDREEFLRPELFPGALDVRRVDFERLADSVSLTSRDYVCIMTRGHHYDEILQRQVLATPVRYIGVIGSRGKRKAVDQRLLESGVTPGQLERIHSPIGLPIGGETPEEIAVSITAELIAERCQTQGKIRRREVRLC